MTSSDLSTKLLYYSADPAVRALVLAALAGTALTLARVKDAAARLAVWTAVLYASLGMPFLARLQADDFVVLHCGRGVPAGCRCFGRPARGGFVFQPAPEAPQLPDSRCRGTPIPDGSVAALGDSGGAWACRIVSRGSTCDDGLAAPCDSASAGVARLAGRKDSGCARA